MSDPESDPDIVVHASAVALQGRGVLVCGASGRGKSALALALMARGGGLVADDRTCLARRGARILAWAPAPILGLVEARGVGLLRADPDPPTALFAVVDLDAAEPDRLPPPRDRDILGVRLPLVLGAANPNLADSIVQWARTGCRIAP